MINRTLSFLRKQKNGKKINDVLPIIIIDLYKIAKSIGKLFSTFAANKHCRSLKKIKKKFKHEIIRRSFVVGDCRNPRSSH